MRRQSGGLRDRLPVGGGVVCRAFTQVGAIGGRVSAAVWGGYALVLAAMSVVTFAVYAWDKRRARRGGWRVRERTLHTLELLGGWPGGLLARRVLRHKSSKRPFRLRSAAVVAVHGLGVAAAAWWAWGG